MKTLLKYSWIALGGFVVAALISMAVAYSASPTRYAASNYRDSYFGSTALNGDTGSVAAGDTIDVKGIRTVTVHVIEGGTTTFTVQASYDGCSTFQTLDTFTATTTKPYRDLWADCVRVNTSWTAGTQHVYIRGK